VQNDSRLTIPHPRMHKRRFVLKPICDIDPDINHPLLQQTMRDLLENLAEDGQGILEYK
jgi:2-amino-4-hydroxy-6-hydroxymethyldihydropteridine diphosphokinase